MVLVMKRSYLFIFLSSLSILVPEILFSKEVEWEYLFNGKDLTGWIQRGGYARFDVVDGVIVGTTADGSPNSFLCTERVFGNFDLEMEFKVAPELNCGVQFRSNFVDGLVRGYQYEIDPSPRSWTGGIYEENIRKWLADLSGNPEAMAAFLPGEWNRIRVRAEGDFIRTWINGVPAVSLVDFYTPNGFIALQVHAVPDYKEYKVMYRNIRIRDYGLNEETPDRLNTFLGEWQDSVSGSYARLHLDSSCDGYTISVFAAVGDDEPEYSLRCYTKNSQTSATFLAPGGINARIEGKKLVIKKGRYEIFSGEKKVYDMFLSESVIPDGLCIFDGRPADGWRLDGRGAGIAPGGRLELVPDGRKQSSACYDLGEEDFHLFLSYRVSEKSNGGGCVIDGRYMIILDDAFPGSGNRKAARIRDLKTGMVYNPDVNAARPPGYWQNLEMFVRRDGDTSCLTLILNGKKIYDNLELPEGESIGLLSLVSGNGKTQYRDITYGTVQ